MNVVLDMLSGKVLKDDRSVLLDIRDQTRVQKTSFEILGLPIHVNPFVDSVFYVGGLETAISNEPFQMSLEYEGSRLQCIRLRMSNGPLTSGGWDQISEKKMAREIRMLKECFTAAIARAPDGKRRLGCFWKVPWGQVQISWEFKSWSVGAYLYPHAFAPKLP